MRSSVQQLRSAFDELSKADQSEVVTEIMRRTRDFDFAPLADEELIMGAEELFLELGRQEAGLACSFPRLSD